MFFEKLVFFFSSGYRNAEPEPPLYMELEKETPLQEDAAADAVLNPIYDRFVCLLLVNFELFYFNRHLSSLGGDSQFFSLSHTLHQVNKIYLFELG